MENKKSKKEILYGKLGPLFSKKYILLEKTRIMEEYRHQKIKEYSVVILDMPIEMKQKLTEKTKQITPQESFFRYFSCAKPKYEYQLFKLKFAEIFCSIESKYLSSDMDAGEIDRFWSFFEVLFEGMPGSNKKSTPNPQENT